MNKGIWTKKYLWAVLVLLCVHAGPYLLLPVITVYGRMLSGSDTLAGMMASVFALSGLFARFLSAYLLDRMPVKKVLRLFTAAMAAASFLYIFSNAYWQAFVLRGLQGFFYGVTCTAMSTYIVRLLDPADRLEGIGYSSLTGNLANAVCPTISYALLGPDVNRFRWLFTAVFLSVVISFLMMIPISGNVQSRQESKVTGSAAGNISAILVPFLTWVCMSFSLSSVSAFLSLSALEKGFAGIGLYFTCNVAGLVTSRVVMRKMMDIIGEKRMICGMIITIALSLCGIALSSDVRQLYVIGLAVGFANGCLAPMINTKMVNSLPDSAGGFANAAFFAAGDIGFIIGPTFWGVIAGILNYQSVFIAASCIGIPALGMQMFAEEKRRHSK